MSAPRMTLGVSVLWDGSEILEHQCIDANLQALSWYEPRPPITLREEAAESSIWLQDPELGVDLHSMLLKPFVIVLNIHIVNTVFPSDFVGR